MAELERQTAPKAEKVDEIVEQLTPDQARKARHDKLKADLDGILDEIEEVLEDNAEEFVRSFVQKGGQ